MTNNHPIGNIINTSIYLSQSYGDAWSDYQRSLKSNSFPVWDYIILTASNEHQAGMFEKQIEARKGYLPARTHFAVVPDEGGVRVGSGGATLSVLKYLRERIPTFSGYRVLVIHSGGDSKRVPQYSALGKLFSPVPHQLPDGRSSTLFDEFLISVSAVPGRIREGMLLLSGDVLLLFNPLLIDYSGHGAAAISFKEDVETGKDHGVFLCGEDGEVRRFLHKQTVDTLREAGAVNSAGAVDIDTGALIFGVDVLEALWSLISVKSEFSEELYRKYVNDTVRLSLYGDFQYPLAADSTLEKYYLEKPDGAYSDALRAARTSVWSVLRPFRLKILRMAPAKFIHFGTTKEILKLMNGEVEKYRELGWSSRVNCSMGTSSGYNSVLSPNAEIGSDCYLEVSYVHSGAKIGNGVVLSYIDIHAGEVVPDHVVLHGLKESDGKFVCRIYGTEDNPKLPVLFGRDLEKLADRSGVELWIGDEEHNLWNARLYPECNTIKEAVAAALRLYTIIQSGDMAVLSEWRERESMCSGFNDADPKAVFEWNKRMSELVQMNDVAALIDSHKPADQARLELPLTPIQRSWMEGKIASADYSTAMRLHYYIGTALGDETEIGQAFSVLRKAVREASISDTKEKSEGRICRDTFTVSLPLRVNWGGGWSDTPPYCNENGGTVLNAAIKVNGMLPVSVTLKRLDERKIVFVSHDMDAYGEFCDIQSLQRVGDPFDSFVLQKAALLACGVIPADGGNLEDVLNRLGGGIMMDTEVTGVPKGSGLGTSSILAAACVKALFEFIGISYDDGLLYSTVLCMEQIMSTGGGWQDQVGGMTDGIKFITSRPELRQRLNVQYVKLEQKTMTELNDRFALIYTGQRRLARNLLRDVIGRYIGNEPDALYTLNEIQRVASLMRFELERGHVDDFAKLLSHHWELSKKLDAGSTNTLIDQIFDCVDDMIDGRMICGAGGGGFLQVILKEGITKSALQKRLKKVFQDTDINVWNCELIFSEANRSAV